MKTPTGPSPRNGGSVERRSARYGPDHRHDPERPGRSLVAGLIAIVVVVVVAVLSSPLVPDSWPAGPAKETGPTATAGTPSTVVCRTSAGGGGWTGHALTGDLVEYAAGSAYLEPDVEAAKAALAHAGA